MSQRTTWVHGLYYVRESAKARGYTVHKNFPRLAAGSHVSVWIPKSQLKDERQPDPTNASLRDVEVPTWLIDKWGWRAKPDFFNVEFKVDQQSGDEYVVVRSAKKKKLTIAKVAKPKTSQALRDAWNHIETLIQNNEPDPPPTWSDAKEALQRLKRRKVK